MANNLIDFCEEGNFDFYSKHDNQEAVNQFLDKFRSEYSEKSAADTEEFIQKNFDKDSFFDKLDIFDPSRIKIGDKLGEGGFAKVYNGYKNGSSHIVLKFFKKTQISQLEFYAQIANENKILQTVSNIGYLKYEGMFKNKTKIDLEVPECVMAIEKGKVDLENALKYRREQKLKYTVEEVTFIIEELAYQLSDLKERGNIAHRDIKPGNVIIVRRNGEIMYLLSDFGNSCVVDGFEIYKRSLPKYLYLYTKAYSAPEYEEFLSDMNFHKNKKYDPFKADIYSLGIAFRNLLGKKRFKKSPIEIQNLVNSMIEENPKDRINMDTLYGLLCKAPKSKPDEAVVLNHFKNENKKNSEKNSTKIKNEILELEKEIKKSLDGKKFEIALKFARKALDIIEDKKLQIRTKERKLVYENYALIYYRSFLQKNKGNKTKVSEEASEDFKSTVKYLEEVLKQEGITHNTEKDRVDADVFYTIGSLLLTLPSIRLNLAEEFIIKAFLKDQKNSQKYFEKLCEIYKKVISIKGPKDPKEKEKLKKNCDNDFTENIFKIFEYLTALTNSDKYYLRGIFLCETVERQYNNSKCEAKCSYNYGLLLMKLAFLYKEKKQNANFERYKEKFYRLTKINMEKFDFEISEIREKLEACSRLNSD